jgi:hypothetical protein
MLKPSNLLEKYQQKESKICVRSDHYSDNLYQEKRHNNLLLFLQRAISLAIPKLFHAKDYNVTISF